MTSPSSPSADGGFAPLVTVIGFHHARGPEVEMWFGAEEGTDPAVDNEWPLLPFMALSDGAHASTEDFSYFTLLLPSHSPSKPATSLFGISCTRQLPTSSLLNRPADVTRSTVQKAVVVIASSPQHFGVMRERLSVVTSAWFAQKDFSEVEILRRFQESLADEERRRKGEDEEDRDQYLGMSLRMLVKEFRWQTLVLFKCCLLQPKMLFFGSRCERLCMMQFSLISLIPGLIRNLKDCADAALDSYEKGLVRAQGMKSSDRNSLLAYMGLPLQIFGKGSLFGPYTPLQQLDILADYGTKSYIVGSTNSLLLQQRDRYSDILINLDETTINITSSSLRSALSLSIADRRWIDFITQSVTDTWDDANPSRPKTMGYAGSEEFIRLQFEEYLLAMLSSVNCHAYILAHAHNPRASLPTTDGTDPSLDFNPDFIDAWTKTANHALWKKNTDSHLFDIVEPKHPCAGGLTIDDVQRRLAQQVQDFHLDERFAVGREVVGRNLAAGREKASSVFGKLYADMEALREAQRRKAEAAKMNALNNANAAAGANGHGGGGGGGGRGGNSPSSTGPLSPTGVNFDGVGRGVQSTVGKAGAYMSSWASWAGEKRRGGWGRTASSGSGSGGSSTASTLKRQVTAPSVPVRTPSSGEKAASEQEREREKEVEEEERQDGESLFDADADTSLDTIETETETAAVATVGHKGKNGTKTEIEHEHEHEHEHEQEASVDATNVWKESDSASPVATTTTNGGHNI